METLEPSVLYVEDDRKSANIMRILLTNRMKLSHVTIFDNSTDFLGRAEALDPKPDVILLDIHVLPYNGFDMLDMLRKSPSFAETPVIALTASVMNEEVAQLRHAGFNGCIAKPIDSDHFPELLTAVMRGKSVWNITV